MRPQTSQNQSPGGIGILLEGRKDITIGSITIQNFLYGIYINNSSNNYIIHNNTTKNSKGIMIEHSSENKIHQNQISHNLDAGIYLSESSDTQIAGNLIEGNANTGISLFLTENILNEIAVTAIKNCAIRGNLVGIRIINSLNTSSTPLIIDSNITNNNIGIRLEGSLAVIQFNNIANNLIGIKISGSENRIDHNNIINNTKQVYDLAWDNPDLSPSINTWHEGDTGNYWSDYYGTGETPYIIDETNKDPSPVMHPFRVPNEPRDSTNEFIIPFIFYVIILTIAIIAAIMLFASIKKKKSTQ